jgi:putative transposase
MPHYRRVYIPGGTYFFTVSLLERRTKLLTANIKLLNHAIARTKRGYPFRIEALVILPDHLHAVFTLPPDETDFSTRMRLIKYRFAKALPKTEWLSAVREDKGERGIWQRRFWEHSIRDHADFRNHIDYCYNNPVKHGLVQDVGDWPHSTYHRDVRCGRFERDFNVREITGTTFGERETNEEA